LPLPKPLPKLTASSTDCPNQGMARKPSSKSGVSIAGFGFEAQLWAAILVTN